MHRLTHAAAVDYVAKATRGPTAVVADSPQGVLGVDSRGLLVMELQALQ